ncbi:ycfH [Wigglesworthia glossinidia endosymbiont of Glossina brevipalpis]|uniref:YcfH protein n=1 Tax=Wigglesworthia glossinidia brevipalpis TaxID=36870 RepID=Q8D3A5_WIGBR|nr:ycfH [Wigglesworthia glossinidia endosymbiont of Glossina brevipalpis]
MFLIDSHCHLDLLIDNNKSKNNIDDVICNAEKKNVKLILSVCISIDGFFSMKKTLNNRKNVLMSCGVHPLYIDEKYNFNVLKNLSDKNYVVAIGETGLDFSHGKKNIYIQKKVFIDHINISKKLKKPIIVHTRNSAKESFKILKEKNIYQSGCIIHCFTEDKNIAKMFLDIGCYISFSGIVTFNNAELIRESVKYVPLDRILIETDSPYLTPVPYRGKKNQPSYLFFIAKCISKIKKINLEQFSKITSNNFKNLFSNISINIEN